MTGDEGGCVRWNGAEKPGWSMATAEILLTRIPACQGWPKRGWMLAGNRQNFKQRVYNCVMGTAVCGKNLKMSFWTMRAAVGNRVQETGTNQILQA